MKQLKIITLLLLFSKIIMGQGLFESAGEEQSKLAYNLNGYVRGAYFIGESLTNENKPSTQATFGETALKLSVKKAGFGEAFSDIRFAGGYKFGNKFTQIDVREAYIKYYAGKFKFSMGKQIKVWGRADAFNPTDMLSLQNMMSRSANEDDKRFGNWMLTAGYNIGFFGIEGVWIPVYNSHKIPFDLMGQMFGMPLQQPNYPNFDIKNSSFAVKINLQGAKIDGSLSYFSGYNPKPAINGNITKSFEINIMPTAYKTNMVGADFQTTVGSFGLRGEFAYLHPVQGDVKFDYLPNPDLQYVIGTDRTWGNFMVTLQYLGKWVTNFEEQQHPTDLTKLFGYMMSKQNRIFCGQQHEFSHNISSRLSQRLFSETLEISAFGMYNFSTKEYMVRPKIDYFITDAMTLSAGMEFFHGEKETLFGMLDKVLNNGFLELKISF